jgi:hypothetical protein
LAHRYDLVDRKRDHNQHCQRRDQAQRAKGADYDGLDDDEKNGDLLEVVWVLLGDFGRSVLLCLRPS